MKICKILIYIVIVVVFGFLMLFAFQSAKEAEKLNYEFYNNYEEFERKVVEGSEKESSEFPYQLIIMSIIFTIIYRHSSIFGFLVTTFIFWGISSLLPSTQYLLGNPINVICYAIISFYIFTPLLYLTKGLPKN